ncbi:hypothetical protein DMC30DRAFT_365901, partial [Rhodotorula diobovata]
HVPAEAGPRRPRVLPRGRPLLLLLLAQHRRRGDETRALLLLLVVLVRHRRRRHERRIVRLSAPAGGTGEEPPLTLAQLERRPVRLVIPL